MSLVKALRYNGGGKILTLFSRKGAQYFNTRAAYLLLDENALREAKDAAELARAGGYGDLLGL